MKTKNNNHSLLMTSDANRLKLGWLNLFIYIYIYFSYNHVWSYRTELMGDWKNSVTHLKSQVNRKRKRKWKKYFVRFVRILSRIPKLSLFLFIYYMCIYIYICIYIKLRLKWKKFHEQKVFCFRFYILSENFSKIGPIIKKIQNFVNDPLKWRVFRNYLFKYSA